MSRTETVFANAAMVLEDEVCNGSICIRDGVIEAIDSGRHVGAGAVDCEGDWLTPGFVELHTDNLERHIAPRPGVDWPHGPAIVAHDSELASVGITTVFDALRVGSLSEANNAYEPYARGLASELLDLRRHGGLRISHYLHLRAEICSETVTEELAQFAAHDRVGIVSLMDHTPGQRQFRDITQYRRYMTGKHGMSDAQFDAYVDRMRALSERVGADHRHRAAAEAHRLGAILASHDDTTADDVTASQAEGVHIAEFPTTPEAAAACQAASMAVVMGAPNVIRGGSHSGNVAAIDLARDGLLDILSSDYIPAALLLAAFQLGDFWEDLPRAIATITLNPARAAGLDDRGRIAPGHRADVLRVGLIDGTPRVKETWVRGSRVA